MAGLHILVADSCPDTASTTALMLCLDGHHVQIALDGPTAIAKAREGKPDIVLLDIDLPGMNGYEVCRRLREDLFHKPLLVIAVAGYGQESDRRRSQEAGIDMHLAKPLDPLPLMTIVSRFAKVVA